ncbi:purine-nucleoside phosphorylase [Mycoplasmopsis californica HAZ160_1]|uniref:Uridine phosphorylase n=2 Tax=Mycoplasmopsis californica TaxID=2113 RepID=A0A059XWN5_9BACT|nr:purine-nucleoside phosphorylase [Mycoplasmopsis californica]AIA29642.1 purine nucleoside phosphorylase [Mycoplasmopsis californica]BAP00922.1 purine-nucleoside phosphorylase [Mycoplasmopsis californica HAZ160_1]BBG40784.1 purine-nucleoside phosphorylase [Mycoplasmopsis californica]BBG41378.1 purine-nucleoside phosphorylase [Mycoplasmopsis californica]BBG41971.1 purine-nucleoside phosphorylase [Mycoplasmopsis californica]
MIPTPHIHAKQGEIAKTVLMPGDPLRAKFIAETFLEPGFKLVNTVRNMFIYTGKYQGKEVSIAGSGMGCPSIGIYSYELFAFYGVENIIRIGSAGAYVKELKLYDTVLATHAVADSDHFRRLVLGAQHASKVSKPSQELNNKIIESAKKQGIKLVEGTIHSSDVFYSAQTLEERIKDTGAICVEMESVALFTNAEKLGKNAACLLTISDNIATHEVTTAEERQTAFTNMMKVALGIL